MLQDEQDNFERVPPQSLVLVDSDQTERVRWEAGDHWDEWNNEPFQKRLNTIKSARA